MRQRPPTLNGFALSCAPRSPMRAPDRVTWRRAWPRVRRVRRARPRSRCADVCESSGMRPEPGTHALLRIAAAEVLQCDTHLPEWVVQALRRAPWVVVRRASVREGLIPIGVRGAARSMRFAAWLPPGEVREAVNPRELAARRGWRAHPRAARVP